MTGQCLDSKERGQSHHEITMSFLVDLSSVRSRPSVRLAPEVIALAKLAYRTAASDIEEGKTKRKARHPWIKAFTVLVCRVASCSRLHES
jgi:hypothetical protein